MDILEQQILDYVARPNYQPVKPKVITRRLGLTRDHEAQVRRTVKKMVRGGLLTWGAKHHVLPVREKREQQNSRPKDAGRQDGKRRDSKRRSNSQVVGIFTRHPRGFGFVRSEGSPPPENGEQNDIFIPISYTGDACHGDTVLVEIKKSQEGQQRFPKHKRRNRNDGGKPPRIEGRIVEVQQRATHQFVGTFHLFDRHPFVIIDKNIFAERIPLGRGDTSQIRPGEKIVVEMVRFPSPAVEDLGAAVVVQVLGKASAPGVDTQMIIAEYDLPGEFDEAAIQDAREQAERFANENFEESQRRDLRGLTILAIDPEDARDHDDAVSVELTDDGYKLGVHIADVSYFVRSKSDLDRVARERGTSVYLPDCVIPMLPEIVSNSLASLQPNTPRLAKTVFMTFTREGVMTDVEIMHSLIESQAQFSYKEVDEFYTTKGACARCGVGATNSESGGY